MNHIDILFILFNLLMFFSMFGLGYSLGRLRELKRSLMFIRILLYTLEKAIDQIPKKKIKKRK